VHNCCAGSFSHYNKGNSKFYFNFTEYNFAFS